MLKRMFCILLLLLSQACEFESPGYQDKRPEPVCADDLDCNSAFSCVDGACVSDQAQTTMTGGGTTGDVLVGGESADGGVLDSGEPDSSAPDSEDMDSSAPDSEDMDSREPDSSAPDSEGMDSSAPDSDDMDSSPPDTAEPDMTPTLELEVLSPGVGDVVEVGMPVTLTGRVVESEVPLDALTVTWRSSLAGELFSGTLEADGVSTVVVETLEVGYHLITMVVSGPGGLEESASVQMGVCAWATPESFDTTTNSENWQVFGDAYWDPGGWLEMTGLRMGSKGAIFNIADIVDAGDIGIKFSIYTGGGTGADGFAMSVIQAESVEQLVEVVNAAGSGGALGYGYGGEWGSYDDIPGFHIEFDTWYNVYNGTNELHTDPTRENHIAVLLNGDPGNHYLWETIPTIEDQQWHDIEVDIEGSRVVIRLDGAVIINDIIAGLDFKGGFIGFSGTTGYYTNFHRFDNLQILQECLVP